MQLQHHPIYIYIYCYSADTVLFVHSQHHMDHIICVGLYMYLLMLCIENEQVLQAEVMMRLELG
jgi:hypothetical protein